jgi:hypothetical protein
MNSEDKLIIGGVVLIAAYYAWQQLKNPDQVSKKDAFTYVEKAAQARNTESWFAPLQQKQAIAEVNSNGTTTTYFLDDNDYNSMSRWQRLLFSWDTSLKDLFN